MNIDQINFIETIVNEGSFRKAAEKLYISQPAISASIKKLETELNIELFSKNSYRAELTPQGKVFYDKAKRVLNEFKNLEEFGKTLKTGVEAYINIAIEGSFPLDKILKIFGTIIEKYPNTKFNLVVDYMENVVSYIENKSFDIIICPINFIEGIKIQVEKVFLETVKMYFVVSPEFPLANKSLVTREDLRNYPQVILTNNSDKTYNVVDESSKWYVNDFFLKKHIIMQGLGYGSLPEFYICNELRNKTLVPLKNYENFKVLESEFYAFRNKNINHGFVGRDLWEAMEKY